MTLPQLILSSQRLYNPSVLKAHTTEIFLFAAHCSDPSQILPNTHTQSQYFESYENNWGYRDGVGFREWGVVVLKCLLHSVLTFIKLLGQFSVVLPKKKSHTILSDCCTTGQIVLCLRALD